MALQKFSQLFSPSFLSETSLTRTLGEEFPLCENGNVTFHWADFFETCEVLKEQLEKNVTLSEDFKKREHSLKRLTLVPVWIKTDKSIHQTTMFELYEKYILNQFQVIAGVDPFTPYEISLISGTGPFKLMTVAECFNRSTYREFVMVYLLQEKLPRRDFRVRLKSKILLEYGTDFGSAELISLEQLTTGGLLFSMDSETFLKKISGQDYVRILLNSKNFIEGTGKNLVELKSYLSEFSHNLFYSSCKDDGITCSLKDFSVQSSFDFSKQKRVFLFISYSKLETSRPKVVQFIRDFVGHTKKLVKDFYEAEVKSA